MEYSVSFGNVSRYITEMVELIVQKKMLFYVDFKYVKDMFCVMLFVSSNTEAVCFSQIHRSIVKLVLLVASGEDESI